MATIREIRARVSGVKKTRKITSAMKMVSAAKLARAQQAITRARPYAEKLSEVLAAVSSGVDSDAHALLGARERTARLDIVLIASDRGLCGAFNANVCKRAQRLINDRRHSVDAINVICVGRRSVDFAKRHRYNVVKSWVQNPAVTRELASEIAEYLSGRFLIGEADQVIVVYGEFRSAISQVPQAETLLPFMPLDDADTEVRPYTVEPDAPQLLARVLPRAVDFSIFRALLENQASEHGARMTAMDNATNNTDELISTLTLEMNKARQAAITQELAEIVGGAEAL